MSNPRTTFKIVLGSFLLGAMGGASGVIVFDTIEMAHMNVRVRQLETVAGDLKKQADEELALLRSCKVYWLKDIQTFTNTEPQK